MNVYIFTDLEGISGIYTKEQVLQSGTLYQEGRKYLTHDINTVAAALKEAGVDKVYVRDGHGGGNSILYDQLSADVDFVVQGRTRYRFPGMEDCDALILLGYHAMAGTECAILEHSMSSTSIQNYWINGKLAGETAIDAGIAGEFGVPVIMVTGDDKLCKEVKELLPDTVTAEVKKGLSSFGGLMLARQKADALIREKTLEAVEKFKTGAIKPLVYDKPITFRVEYMERINTPSVLERPHVKLIDGRTFEVTGDNMQEAFYRSL